MEEYPRVYLYRRLVKAKLYIDACYNQAIDLDNIAGEAYCSKYHFIRLFREIYGSTPHQYLIKVRIAKAKELLLQGRMVADTCFEVGFESVTSFTGLFKKHIGQSPAAWQSAQQAQKLKLAEKPLLFIPGCFAGAHGWTA